MEALSKRLVMAHGSMRKSAVNVTNKMKQHFFLGMQFLRHTTPYHVQLRISMKISEIRILMTHGESNWVLYIDLT